MIDPADTRSWVREQKKKRSGRARESLDIELWGTNDIVNTNTRLRAQAYEEKLAIRRATPLNLAQKMAKLLHDKLPPESGEPGPSLRVTPARMHNTERAMSVAASVVSSRSSATLRSGSISTQSSSKVSILKTRSIFARNGVSTPASRRSRADSVESRASFSGPSRSQAARAPRKTSK
jgi:histone-lysine N-methyltransferase SUV39H